MNIAAEESVHIPDDNKTWKYGIIIKTKKKDYKIITQSELIMEKFLYAFSCLIDEQTKEPLFSNFILSFIDLIALSKDWSFYKNIDTKSLKSGGKPSFSKEVEILVISPKKLTTSHRKRAI